MVKEKVHLLSKLTQQFNVMWNSLVKFFNCHVPQVYQHDSWYQVEGQKLKEKKILNHD